MLLATFLAVDEPHDGDLHAGVLGHPPGELERLAVVRPAEEDDADAVRDLLRADLLAAAEAAVDEDGDRAGRLAQDPPVDGAPLGAEVVSMAVARVALVEREHDEGDALVLGDGGDVVVDGVERGDGGHGADVDVAELRVGVEGDVHLVAAAAARAEEGTPLRRGAGHEDGGGALGELDHAEDVELDEAARLGVAADGLDEVDQRRHVVAAVDAGQHAQLLAPAVAAADGEDGAEGHAACGGAGGGGRRCAPACRWP